MSLRIKAIVSFCALIMFVNFWAYWPALQHLPKHNQLGYMASTVGKKDLFSLTLGYYSYNRIKTKSVGSADQLLFRPLLSIIQGAEQYFFGNRFFLWQLTGIILHLTVCAFLALFLWTIRPGISALIMTSFFSLMLVHVPMVNWPTVHPYMFFCVLLLISLRDLYLWSREGRSHDAYLIRSAVLLGLGNFIYETSVVFSIIISIYVLLNLPRGSRSKAAWLLWPVALYIALSIADLLLLHHVAGTESTNVLTHIATFDTVLNYLLTLKWFIFGGIFTRLSDMVEFFRTVIYPYTFDPHWPFTSMNSHLFRGLILLGVAVVVLIKGIDHERWKQRLPFLGLLLSLLSAYVLVIVCGRLNPRGVESGLCFNVYYFYIFWAILLPCLYLCIDPAQFQKNMSWKMFRYLSVTVILAVLFINTLSIRKLNESTSKVQEPTRKFLRHIDSFVKLHHNETDFTFFVDPFCSGNYPQWIPEPGNLKWEEYSVAPFYYPQYYTKVQPKYRIACPDLK